jgi:hypothetical protein
MSIWGKSPYLSCFHSKHRTLSLNSQLHISPILEFVPTIRLLKTKNHVSVSYRRLMNTPAQFYGDRLGENEIEVFIKQTEKWSKRTR